MRTLLMMRRALLRTAAVSSLAMLGLGNTWAQSAPAAARTDTERIILEVRSGDGKHATFTASALRALPQKSIVTQTPWFDTSMTFTGPLLKDVLAAAKVKDGATRLRLTALNDYAVEVPVSDLDTYQPVLSLLLNGKPMSIREKGPLFLMYPFDARPEIKNDIFYGRAIWQIATITVF